MYMGNTCTIKIIYDYNADNFDHSDLDFIGGMQLYSEPCEREPVNSVRGSRRQSGKSWGAEWKARARPQLGLVRRRSTPRGERFPTRTSSSTSTRTTRDRFGNHSCASPSTGTTTSSAMWRFIVRPGEGDHDAR